MPTYSFASAGFEKKKKAYGVMRAYNRVSSLVGSRVISLTLCFLNRDLKEKLS
jgi:hypothetical protein